MILSFDELSDYRGQVVLVDGAFDPLHAGHIDYFRKARALGRPLLCNLASDAYIRTKHSVLLPADQRLAVIDALQDVSFVHLNESTTESVLEQLRPYAYVKGRDWEGRLPAMQVAVCRQFGIRSVFVETVSESSTRLLQAVLSVPQGPSTSAAPLATAHPDS